MSSILIIATLRVPRKQQFASPVGRGNYGNSATGQPPTPVLLIESVEKITLTKYLSFRPFYKGVGGWDNRSSSCTRDSARELRNANVPTGSLGYDVYPATVHLTLRHSYLHQSRHRDSATANVTHRHSYLHQTHGRDMVRAILQAAQQLWRNVTCVAPSKLISLVLVTASLELLGFEIRSRQAISIPKRKVLCTCLATETLSLSSCGLGSICDIAISLFPYRRARNGSLLTLRKLHLLSINRNWFGDLLRLVICWKINFLTIRFSLKEDCNLGCLCLFCLKNLTNPLRNHYPISTQVLLA